MRKGNKGEKEIWEEQEKVKKSTSIVLILSLLGGRKQTDKEERDNKERMDCYIFKHPWASEQEREREKEEKRRKNIWPWS